MKTSNKILALLLGLICIVSIISIIIIGPWIHSESSYYLDSKLRKSLAGNIDYIVLGASHGMAGFNPEILDENLSCNSYNLSNSMMTMNGRCYLLDKELSRNPVKTVVLEISYDALYRDSANEYAEGDAITLARLDSFGERMSFLLKYLQLNDWLNVYSRNLVDGSRYWVYKVLGVSDDTVDYAAKGYHVTERCDQSLSNTEIISTYDESVLTFDFRDENIAQLESLIKACEERECRLIITVTPITDALIWQNKGWDDFNNQMVEYCVNHKIEYYDFNLIKKRYSIFSDSVSYHDSGHLCESGAQKFSHLFCDVMRRVDQGEDVTDLFYDSYESMKQDSPYMVYYREYSRKE